MVSDRSKIKLGKWDREGLRTRTLLTRAILLEKRHLSCDLSDESKKSQPCQDLGKSIPGKERSSLEDSNSRQAP